MKFYDWVDAAFEYKFRPVTDPVEWSMLIPMAREYCGIPDNVPCCEARALRELRATEELGLMPADALQLVFRFTENTYEVEL